MPVIAISFGAGARADSGSSVIWARPIGNGAGSAADDSSSTEASFRVVPGPTPTKSPPPGPGPGPGPGFEDDGDFEDDLLDDIEARVEDGIKDIEDGVGDAEPDSGKHGPKHFRPGHADFDDSDPVDFGNIGPGPVGPAPTGDPSLPFTGIDGRRLAVQALAGAGAVLVGACLILLSTSRRRHRKKG